MVQTDFFIGVDVGTGSARAALVDKQGFIRKVATKEIKVWSPRPNYYQQSSEDIWRAVCYIVKEVTLGVDPCHVKGIGFDATCSLVVIGMNERPVTVSPDGESEQNVILWMDHRAEEEAQTINATKHPLLKNVGGRVSLEMELPKLMWLKKHLRKECWDRAVMFFDLPDFLTWKATRSTSRSLCSLVCKWLYDACPEKSQWDLDLLAKIGLSDLSEDNFSKIGQEVKSPGQPCGDGLSPWAAHELSLKAGTPVGTSIIDAHAGGLGLIGCKAEGACENVTERLSLICGTSTCHMAVSQRKLFVEGVWGPYFSAMMPGLWLNEAGQSATGKLIDHIIETHSALPQIQRKLPDGVRPVDYLNNLLHRISSEKKIEIDELTKDLHIWPDFHGNRSPVADSTLRGMISGLDLTSDENQLALLYLATLQALAYGTRHIMEVMEDNGHFFENILICGGLSKNKVFLQTQANVVGKAVLIPIEPEPVLIGAAILGATASGTFSSVETAIKEMGGVADKVVPRNNAARYHDKKYQVFRLMLEHQQIYRGVMDTI